MRPFLCRLRAALPGPPPPAPFSLAIPTARTTPAGIPWEAHRVFLEYHRESGIQALLFTVSPAHEMQALRAKYALPFISLPGTDSWACATDGHDNPAAKGLQTLSIPAKDTVLGLFARHHRDQRAPVSALYLPQGVLFSPNLGITGRGEGMCPYLALNSDGPIGHPAATHLHLAPSASAHQHLRAPEAARAALAALFPTISTPSSPGRPTTRRPLAITIDLVD